MATATRLLTPSTKIEQRLFRAALAEYAAECGIDFITVETAYTNVRSSLAHLAHGEQYAPLLGHKLAAVVDRLRDVLTAEGVEQVYTGEHLKKLSSVTDEIGGFSKKLLRTQSLDTKDVQMFVEVVDRICKKYVEAGYDHSRVVQPNVHALALTLCNNADQT